MERENITKQTVLVALMPNYEDWRILHEQLWYRIPVEKAPPIVQTGAVQYLAFYHTNRFAPDLKWKIVKYAKIKQISVVHRRDLFNPAFDAPQKANNQYYKMELEPLLALNVPFVSRRGHRMVFLPTTEQQLFSGQTDFNSLFKNSLLEQKMVHIMDDLQVEYEREWFFEVAPKKSYRLDFVIFCKKGNINVECDGDQYHTHKTNVQLDKMRNNELASHGWSVLRYTTQDFEQNTGFIQQNLCKTIAQYGGIRYAAEPEMNYSTKRG
jgi:REase_MTES_1575